MEKVLTIIIPTYNMEKYLDKCLTSLIIEDKELMKQLEVLVVIDGAKDRSSEIAHTYQDKYPETFIVIDKENGNYGSCINRGLREGTGKYVKVLDADDSFNTKNFESYLTFLTSADFDLILTPYVIVNEKGEETSHKGYNLSHDSVLTWENLSEELRKNHLQMHAVTYKLENIKRLNYSQTEGISYTDQEWDFTPLYAVESICYYSKEVYCYLLGRVGQTMSVEAQKRNSHHNELCVRKIVKDFSAFEVVESAKYRYLKYECLNSIKTIYTNYLLKYPELPLENIKSFDAYIKECNKSLYDSMNDVVIPYTGFKFIKKWHQDVNCSMNIVELFLYKYSKIISSIKYRINALIRNFF